MIGSSQYFAELSTAIGKGWNRFWFTPADALPLAVLRIGAGLVGLYFLLSHSADLIAWFGPRGLLSIDTVGKLSDELGAQAFRPSLLYLTDVPEFLWAIHAASIAVMLAMTVGIFTRVTTVLSLVVVLSYVHRAPLITGPVEPILTMLLAYLSLGPSGQHLSLDRLFFRKPIAAGSAADRPSWIANLSLRLIQVHLAGFYILMGLTQLAGAAWWEGMAIWWLVAHADSRIVDLTGLHRFPVLPQLATHAVVLFELSFGVLIWNRLARPLLLMIGVGMWLMLAVVSAQLAFGAIMLVANLAFVPGDFWRSLLSAQQRERNA